MLNNPYFWWSVLVLWVASDIYFFVRNYKGRGLPYAVKCEINSLKNLAVLIWAVVFLMAGLLLMPSIIKFVEQYQVTEQYAKVVVSILPTFYALTIMAIYFLVVISNNSHPFIEYTDEERQWQKDDAEKFRGKLPKQLRWLVKLEPEKKK